MQGLSAADRVLAVLPLFHVGGLCIQVLPALACGAVVNLHARFEPGAWLHDVATWRPTTSLLVPAVMQALIHHPGWPAADLHSQLPEKVQQFGSKSHYNNTVQAGDGDGRSQVPLLALALVLALGAGWLVQAFGG